MERLGSETDSDDFSDHEFDRVERQRSDEEINQYECVEETAQHQLKETTEVN